MTDSITYRKANEEDYPAVLELYNEMYISNRSLKDYLWLVKNNPAGEAVVFLACQETKVVGIQSLIPYEFIQDGQRIFTYKSEDSLVKNDLRGKGIYSTLYSMVHDFTPETLVWGLTDKKAILENVGMPSSQRLLIAVSVKRPGFTQEFKGMQRFIAKSLFYSWVYFKTNFTKRTASSNLALDELDLTTNEGEGLTQFFKTLSKEYPTICFPVMNKEYLDWRLRQNPNLDDYKLFCSFTKEGMICMCSIIGLKGKSAYWQSFYALPHVSKEDQLGHVQLIRENIFKAGYQIIHTWLFENNKVVKEVKTLFLKSGFSGVRNGLWIVNNSHRVDEDAHDLYFSPQLGIR